MECTDRGVGVANVCLTVEIPLPYTAGRTIVADVDTSFKESEKISHVLKVPVRCE